MRIRDWWVRTQFQRRIARGEARPTPVPAYKPGDQPRLLFVVTTSLGDLIGISACIDEARRVYPAGFFGVLARHPFGELYRSDPRVDVVIPYRGKYRSERETGAAISSHRFDVGLLFNINDPDVIPLIYDAGVRCLLRLPSRSTVYKRICANEEELDRPTLEHKYEMDARLMRHVGVDPKTRHPVLSPGPDAQKDASDFIQSAGLAERSLIAIHPGASVPAKCWSEDRVAALIRMLAQRLPAAAILLTGAPDESEKCGRIEVASGAAITNAAGKLDLPAMAALYSRLSLFVGGDSAAFHLAHAFQIPSVILYFGTPVHRTRPLPGTGRHRILEQSGPVTARGVEAIEPAEVFANCEELTNG